MIQSTGNIVADTICRTTELGLTITNASTTDEMTTLYCEPINPINRCPVCDHPGRLRDHTTRTLVDLPIVGFPTTLCVRIPRYECVNTSCHRSIFQAGLGVCSPEIKSHQPGYTLDIPTPCPGSDECCYDRESTWLGLGSDLQACTRCMP